MCVTACPFWNVYAKGLSISSGPLVDAGVEKHHHIGLLLVLPFFKLFLCNLTNKKWSILGFLLQLGNVPFLRWCYQGGVPTWQKYGIIIFKMGMWTTVRSGSVCTIACVSSLLSWSATSNVHTDCERVQTTLQDSDIHRAKCIIIPSKSRDQI